MRSRNLLVVVLAIAALGACGGDDSSDGAGDVEPTATPASGGTSAANDAPVASAVAAVSTQPEQSPATDPPDDAAQPASDGECAVTTEQVSTIMAVEMVPLASTCSWEAPGLEGAVVEVYLNGGDAMMFDMAEGEEVAGIGDEARFDLIDVLNIRIGDNYYFVQVLAMGGATAVFVRDAAIELAALWIPTL